MKKAIIGRILAFAFVVTLVVGIITIITVPVVYYHMFGYTLEIWADKMIFHPHWVTIFGWALVFVSMICGAETFYRAWDRL